MWTDDEISDVYHYFGEQIKSGENVKEKECRRVIEECKAKGRPLARRKWMTIKKKVNYLIHKKPK